MDNQEEIPKERFNSAQKIIKVTESKSTSLSSSSSQSSTKRFNTDTKFPKNMLSKKKKNSIIQKGHKQRFQVNQNLTVQQEGEEQDKNQTNDNQHKLPHFTIFNDRREFNQSNNQRRKNTKYQLSRCKSVGTLRLPRVVEEKKEEEENNRHISKLNNLLDKNQFNVRKSVSNTIHILNSQNIDMYNKNFGQTEIIAQIGEVEQSKDSKITSTEKSMQHRIGNQLEKIIVDEIDEKKKYRQQREEPVIESIIEQKNDDDFVDQQLRCVLSKLQDQKQFIKKMIKSESIHDDIIPLENENITLLTQCIKEENEGENEN